MRGIFLFVICFIFSCKSNNNIKEETYMVKEIGTKNKKEIYFAGGCFWGTEHFFKQIRGVETTEVGYANGEGENPTYKSVCRREGEFSETVKVVYNENVISLEKLVNLYFKTIDPTSVNRQGNDVGVQYRTGIYYVEEGQGTIINKCVTELGKEYSKPLAVEVGMLKNFYKAEDYHQDYLDKNSGRYCHIPSGLFEFAKEANAMEFKKEDKEVLRQKLTDIQYMVTQNSYTERPFENEYFDEFREGIYVDVTNGQPLFVSSDKFESGCGWPSFSKPIDVALVKVVQDSTLGMSRVEVRSKTGDSHLGHVFEDGPKSLGGLRYCINSASLRFIPKEKMQEEGYGEYIKLIRTSER